MEKERGEEEGREGGRGEKEGNREKIGQREKEMEATDYWLQ